MFGTAGHSVVDQEMASPGLSDASNCKHLFVSFLLFAGPTLGRRSPCAATSSQFGDYYVI